MGNTLTNTDPEIIVNECFPAFRAGLAPVNAFSTDFAAEAAAKGASIQVPVITAKSANTSFASDYESGDTTIVGKQVLLNTHVFSSTHMTDVEAGKTPVNAFMAAAKEDAYAVGLSAFQTVIGLIVAGTFGDVANTSKKVVTAANFDADDVADLVTMLGKRNALGDKSLITDLDYYGALLKDNAIQNASAMGSSVPIREGAVTRLLGCNVYESNAFPTALTNENTGAIVVVPSAIAVASRPVVPQEGAAGAGLEFSTATDPETGLTLGYRRWYNTKTGIRWHAFEILLGAVAVQTAGAVRAVSA